MLPIIGAALVGAVLMGRTKPRTAATRKLLLGPHSGATYQVEDFAQAGFIVVRAADGSVGVFARKLSDKPGAPGFQWHQGRGQAQTLRAMAIDVCGPPKPADTTPPKG
ncbi:MAG: hypothetical protein ACPG77_10705 [Nannocystaceae bacterium]